MKREELHDILYEILCEIDDACRKENVPYFFVGGTLLGAIRHQGFIPWDDDVDIGVWRRDYPAIRDALKKHLPPYMRVVEPEEFAPHFYDFIVRVQDTRYHWHEPTDEDLQYGNLQNYINCDIFNYVYCSNSKLCVKLYTLAHKFVYGLAMAHRVKLDYSQYKGVQKILVRVLSTVGKLFKVETLHKMHKKLCALRDVPKKYAFTVNANMNEMGTGYLESAWQEETIDKPFRDRMFPVPSKYHERLTAGYGDYMKPPKDKSIYIQHMHFDEE